MVDQNVRLFRRLPLVYNHLLPALLHHGEKRGSARGGLPNDMLPGVPGCPVWTNTSLENSAGKRSQGKYGDGWRVLAVLPALCFVPGGKRVGVE